MVTIKNVSGEPVDARAWAGRFLDPDEQVELAGVVVAELPDAVVVRLDGDLQDRACPLSLWEVTGEHADPADRDDPAADPVEVPARDLVTAVVADGAVFAPGAADEGNPLGLFAADEKTEQPPAPRADPPTTGPQTDTPPAAPPAPADTPKGA